MCNSVKKLIFWLMAALITNHIGTLSANEPTTQRLLVLGDSLSAAYGLDIQDGWVVQLGKALETRNIEVINASVSGETTSGGLSRLPRLLERHQPQWVLIQLGANDGLRGLPLPSIRQNLAQMIQIVEDYGAQAVLIGIKLPPNYGPMYAEPFAALYAELASDYELPLVPFLLEGVADDPSKMQADGLHPTAEAQLTILENVRAVLDPLLESKAK